VPDDEKLRLGGMALRNGLLVHGPTHWAAAVRTPAPAGGSLGEIAVASGRKPRAPKAFDRLPGARGVVRLSEAMIVIPLVKRALPQAQMPYQDAGTAGTMAATMAAAALLRRRARGIGGEAALAALALAPSVVALRRGQLAEYHGAEHKVIGAYERPEQDARDTAKEHDRCGSHLMAPLLAANAAGTVLLKQVVAKPRPVHGAAVQLAAVGVAVEVFAWSERHAGSPLSRALRRPGDALQRAIGTREPSDAQLEVGQAALSEILRVESSFPQS
jgi:uncharacterized protein YqhQ